jgi:hypothetical protein
MEKVMVVVLVASASWSFSELQAVMSAATARAVKIYCFIVRKYLDYCFVN